MSAPPNLKVLFFDVFGTCVIQTQAIADELYKAAQEALKSENSSIDNEVRSKATEMTYEEWFDLGNKWNKVNTDFVHKLIEKTGTVDWKAVDDQRIDLLPKLMSEQGVIIPSESSTTTKIQPAPGSLFTQPQLAHLAKIWHRLPPWPDTNKGITLLSSKYPTIALSNTYSTLLNSLVSNASIPFTSLYSADQFQSYKPNPKVYLGAAQKMGVKPEECALVAAHLGDLKGAKDCGFMTFYVEREFEEKQPDLDGKVEVDLRVGMEEEGGLVRLAERLGCVG